MTPLPDIFERILPYAAIGGGFFIFANGFRVRNVKDKILTTPLSRIGSAAMGYVQLSGAAQSSVALIAPFSLTPCCYWEVRLEQFQSGGRGGMSGWFIVEKRTSTQPFYLHDETGSLCIDPQNAMLDIPVDIFVVESVDSDLFQKMFPSNPSGRLRLCEIAIIPEMSLFVSGELMLWKENKNVQECEIICKVQDHPLIISANSVGRIAVKANDYMLWAFASGLLLLSGGIYALVSGSLDECSLPLLYFGLVIAGAGFASQSGFFQTISGPP